MAPIFDTERLQPEQLPLERFPTSLGERLGAEAGETLESLPVPNIFRSSELASAKLGYEGGLFGYSTGTSTPDVPMEEARAKVKAAGLDQHLKLPDDPSIKAPALDIMMERANKRREREATIARGPTGFIPGALSFGTGFFLPLLDPLNDAAFMIPAVGEARGAAWLAGAGDSMMSRAGVRFGIGAAQGAVGTAALQPLEAWARTQEGQDFTAAEAVRNVMMGAGLAGTMHGSFGLVGDAWRRATGQPLKGLPPPPDITAPPPPSGDAGGAIPPGPPGTPGRPTAAPGGIAEPESLTASTDIPAAAPPSGVGTPPELGTGFVRTDYSTTRLDELKAAPEAPQPVGPSATAPSGRIKPGPAIWANRHIDLPIEILDEPPSAGPDGRQYQKVRYEGHENYVPLDEIKGAASSAATQPAATAPAEPSLPAAIVQSLPPAAHRDAMQGALANLIDGEPVQAAEHLEAAGRQDPRIADGLATIDAAAQSPAERERTGIASQIAPAITAAGRSKGEARTIATAVADRYVARAEALGGGAGTPGEMFERAGIEVRPGKEGGALTVVSPKGEAALSRLHAISGMEARGSTAIATPQIASASDFAGAVADLKARLGKSKERKVPVGEDVVDAEVLPPRSFDQSALADKGLFGEDFEAAPHARELTAQPEALQEGSSLRSIATEVKAFSDDAHALLGVARQHNGFELPAGAAEREQLTGALADARDLLDDHAQAGYDLVERIEKLGDELHTRVDKLEDEFLALRDEVDDLRSRIADKLDEIHDAHLEELTERRNAEEEAKGEAAHVPARIEEPAPYPAHYTALDALVHEKRDVAAALERAKASPAVRELLEADVDKLDEASADRITQAVDEDVGALNGAYHAADFWTDKVSNFKDNVSSLMESVTDDVVRPILDAIEETSGALHERVLEGLEPKTRTFEQRVGEGAPQAPPFYSAVERAVTSAKQEKASSDQWLGMLKNMPGVKPEEMEWLGLRDWLKEQKGSVTKQQIADYVRANQIEVKEVEKGEPSPQQERDRENAITVRAQEIARRETGTDWENLPGNERAVYRGMAMDETPDRTGAPKFASYQLPGGENYRELLLTLPEQSRDELNAARRATSDAMDEWKRVAEEFGESDSRAREAKARFQEAAKKSDELGAASKEPFHSSHWDEPNILAHVRFNDRVIDGKKTLLVEEVQSDWHQQGKKKGYKLPAAEAAQLEARRLELETQGGQLRNEGKEIPEEIKREWADIMNRLQPQNTTRVPDAPFKTTWPELAMKRMIRYAAENGYEKVAWTTGETQAARYDLSKQISRLELSKLPTRNEHFLKAVDHQGREVVNKAIADPEKELPDIIGKEATEKLLAQEAAGPKLLSRVEPDQVELTPGAHSWMAETKDGRRTEIGFATAKDAQDAREYASRMWNGQIGEINKRRAEAPKVRKLEGLDLKVGGEGMKGFYDQILPATVNKLTKKFGGKVGEGEVTAGEARQDGISGAWYIHPQTDNASFATKAEAEAAAGKKVHTLDITDKLRDAATEQGFPLFQKGGAGEPQGRVTFANNKRIIELFKSADASTGMHEFGHVWLEELMDDAARADAPDWLRADRDTVREWLGAKGDAPLTTEQHEQFARGFEQYLREGRSPSRRLAAVFAKFREWFMAIYRKASELGVPISDEMRGVYDRLLATREDIAEYAGDRPARLGEDPKSALAGDWQALASGRGRGDAEAVARDAEAVKEPESVKADAATLEAPKAVKAEPSAKEETAGPPKAEASAGASTEVRAGETPAVPAAPARPQSPATKAALTAEERGASDYAARGGDDTWKLMSGETLGDALAAIDRDTMELSTIIDRGAACLAAAMRA